MKEQQEKTINELEEEQTELQDKANKGTITPTEVERLAEINRIVKRAYSVRFGRNWD